MGLKDILLHVDNSRACESRIRMAVELAQAQDAHLTGLYVRPQLELPGYLEAEVGVELLEIQRQAVADLAEAAADTFQNLTGREGLSAEWRAVDGGLARNLNLHARYADVVVVGQADDDDPRCVSQGLADRVVLECGRPVLVCPYIGAQFPLAERVVVAWNATREAVRAVNDALPFLVRAKKVEVIAVNPEPGDAGDGDIPSADICLHLARHGVKAEAHLIQASEIEVGDVLLSRTAEEAGALVVMGAYGHSRLREMVLGGVTRHLLEHMTVPVLMSH
jgi:nucleotide-binding universal stress UspA family protein